MPSPFTSPVPRPWAKCHAPGKPALLMAVAVQGCVGLAPGANQESTSGGSCPMTTSSRPSPKRSARIAVSTAVDGASTYDVQCTSAPAGFLYQSIGSGGGLAGSNRNGATMASVQPSPSTSAPKTAWQTL